MEKTAKIGERLTKTQEILETARLKLGGVTDYKLAKAMGIHRQRMSRLHEGTTQADAYDCAQLALILDRDPLAVIAEVEADSAKSEARRAFWAGFPSGLRRTALGAALLVTFGSSGVGWPGGAQAASPEPLRIMGRYDRRRNDKSPKRGFFSMCRRANADGDRRRPGRTA